MTTRKSKRTWRVWVEFKLHCLWIGVDWGYRDDRLGFTEIAVWICLIPTVVIRLVWRRTIGPDTGVAILPTNRERRIL